MRRFDNQKAYWFLIKPFRCVNRDCFMVGDPVRFSFVNKDRIREPTMMLFIYFINIEISFKMTH